MMSVVFSILLILPCLPGVAAQTNDYVIGPQDILTITIWDQSDLSGKFNVEADGTFTFPLIGRIKGGGLTLRELEEELKKRLADGYFKRPQLSVAVEQYRSQRIFIVGEVRQPGTFPLTGDMTLIEGFARAGGATPDAAGNAIIVRASDGRPTPGGSDEQTSAEIIHVSLRQLETGSLSNNVSLRDGDTIFVPRAEVLTVYVFGQVRSPGAFAIKKDMTVLQALSLAGGVNDRGTTSRIRIVRLVRGKKTELKVNLDDPVQAGDTIMVLERFL
jgi:polysaccharide export outer membrane protein